MANQIYLIRANGLYYVGKYSESSGDDYFIYHLKSALPGSTSVKDTSLRGERKGKEDLKNVGYRDSKFIQSAQSGDASEIIGRLKNSLEKYNEGSNVSMGELICKYWGKTANEDYEVAEALCIMLAAKQFTIWNTQIDFLKHKKGHLTDKDIRELISVDALEKRAHDANKLEPDGWITVDLKAKDITKEMFDLICTAFRIPATDENKKQFFVLKNGEFMKQFSRAISNTTIPHIVRVVKDYKEKVHKFKGSEPLIKALDALIKDLESRNGSKSQYKTIYNIVESALKKVEKEKTKLVLDYEAIEHFLSSFMAWYEGTSLSEILNNGTEYNMDSATTGYKAAFTDHIQEKCFPSVTDIEYHKWKRNIRDNVGLTHSDKLYMRPGAFYPTFLKENEKSFDGDSLRSKTYTIIEAEKNNFISTNGADHIYPEQVAYFLNTTDGAEPFNYSGNISSTFISILADPEKIQGY